MDKNRLFRIMAHAPAESVIALGQIIENGYTVKVLKEPQKALAMIRIRESVKNSDFYLGELLTCEAMVEIEGKKGVAVTMGDDFSKVLSMAVVDAADNAGLPELKRQIEPALLNLERQWIQRIEQENGMYLKTMVNFQSMDSEEPA